MTVVNSAAAGEAANNVDKKVTFKSCASFTSCISTINNTQIDDAQYIDLVMSVYNLIEYMIIMERHQEFYGNIVEMFRL